jgi:hypothetical protein
MLVTVFRPHSFDLNQAASGWTNVIWQNNGNRGVVDYLVTKGTLPTEGKRQIEPISDINGDGKEDWVLVYPNGN